MRILDNNKDCKTYLKMFNLNKNHANNTFYQKTKIKFNHLKATNKNKLE